MADQMRREDVLVLGSICLQRLAQQAPQVCDLALQTGDAVAQVVSLRDLLFAAPRRRALL